MPAFDAHAARALARRTQGVREILAEMKQAIVEAAHRGDFEASVPLPDAQVVPAGRSSNTASFLVAHLQSRDLPGWAEAVQHAARAGYSVSPSWRALANGAGCDGVRLSWSLSLDEPATQPELMAASVAYRLSMSARAQHTWVEKAQEVIRQAAARGATSCTVHDAEAVESPAWPRRRALLERSGFTTELVRTQAGADLLIRW